MDITLNQVLVLAAALFAIGLYGAFSFYSGLEALRGQVFAMFIMVVSACELGLCMAIAIMLHRNRETVAVDELDVMKW